MYTAHREHPLVYRATLTTPSTRSASELLLLAVVAAYAAVVVVLAVRADKANPVRHGVLDHAGKQWGLLDGQEGATRRDTRWQTA